MYDLAEFSIRDMTHCGAALRRTGEAAASMEDVARRMVRFLREHLVLPSGDPACPLVRFFLTQPFADLDAEARAFAARQLGGSAERPRCLALLASAGSRPEWNDRRTSRGHKALPLFGSETVRRLPMVAELLRQLGAEAFPAGAAVDPAECRYDVFYVPEAAGSPHVVDQEFVRAEAIRSVLGFGGLLPSGDLFALVLVGRCAVPPRTAALFRPMALNALLAVLPFTFRDVFASPGVREEMSV